MRKAVLASLILCGCSSAQPPSMPDTVAHTGTSTIQTGSCSPLPVGDLCSGFFDTFQVGTLTVTVDWTSADDAVQAFLSAGNPCSTTQINNGQCVFIAMTSAGTTPKPKVMTVPNTPSNTYSLYIGNRGPHVESVSDQVTLTVTGATPQGTR
jgi:hypothetical protein